MCWGLRWKNRDWRQDVAVTGTLEACRYNVAAAILAASDSGFQPRIPVAGAVAGFARWNPYSLFLRFLPLASHAASATLHAALMKTFANIAAYKFAALPELRLLRVRLLALCKGWELKGTILLSVEGINLFVAGEREKIDLLLAELRSLPGLADLQPKVSETDHQPFRRMLVRLKKEIIAFGVEGINPAERTSPKLAAKTMQHQAFAAVLHNLV